MIPIYGKNQNGRSHSIYLDADTMRVYRSDHEEFNYNKYWVWFFSAIIFIRTLAEINLPDSLLVRVVLVIAVVPVSMYTGKVIHRKSVQNMREIYPTIDMLEDYIEEGKNLFKIELMMAGIISFICLALCFLFIVFNLMIWLIFSVMTFAILGMLSNNVSIKRWKLYKYGLSEIGA